MQSVPCQKKLRPIQHRLMLPNVYIPLQLIRSAGARKKIPEQMQPNKMNLENTQMILVH